MFHAVTGGVSHQQNTKALSMQPPFVIKQGANTCQIDIQPGMVTVPMTVHSSRPASIPNVMTLNKPGGQNVVVTTQNLGYAQPALPPNVQILKTRPRTPAALDAQKSVASLSPRLVIKTPQVVRTRLTAPIKLQTLQSLQTRQQGHLYIKTENGKYKLLRMGPQAQTIRMSSVPTHPGVQTVSTSVAPPGLIPGQTPAAPMAASVVVSAPVVQNGITPMQLQTQQQMTTSTPTQIKPLPQKPGDSIVVLQNILLHTNSKFKMGSSVNKSMNINNKPNYARSIITTNAHSMVLTPGKSLLKEKEKRSFLHRFGDDKMAGDDDINDVAAMGGINLAEEAQRIVGSTEEMIGTQIRSCKEEHLVPMRLMQARIKSIVAKHNLEEPSPEVAVLLSHALQKRLKNLIQKLAVIAQHRIDLIKNDNQYEATQNVKVQLKFLDELDKVDKKRREDSEREILLRAAKSRSKNGDPEQAKLKAKAKEMQRAELEEMRQRKANWTALQAIGPRKKAKLEGSGGAGHSNTTPHPTSRFTGLSQLALRTRLKRITQHDMWFLLEQNRDTSHSMLLYRSYLK